MTTIQLLEAVLVVAGIVGTFLATLKYLVRFQRKIDRLLILMALTRVRVEDLERFLEATTAFRRRKPIESDELPEVNTEFI